MKAENFRTSHDDICLIRINFWIVHLQGKGVHAPLYEQLKVGCWDLNLFYKEYSINYISNCCPMYMSYVAMYFYSRFIMV